jgi:hypothetical protein
MQANWIETLSDWPCFPEARLSPYTEDGRFGQIGWSK